MIIPPEELKLEIYPLPRNVGGQHVGSGPTGVKITHLPTGTIAIVENGRSQHINRLLAIHMLECALTHPDFK